MERTPFAITLDPNTSLANHGKLAHDETDLCRSFATVQPACPAGENIQAWLYHAEGAYEEAWQQLMQDNPMPAIHGRVCYHPVKAPVIVGISMRPSAFTRWNGSWVIRRSRKGWRVACAPRTGKNVLVIGAGQADSPRPITWLGWGIRSPFMKPVHKLAA